MSESSLSDAEVLGMDDDDDDEDVDDDEGDDEDNY